MRTLDTLLYRWVGEVLGSRADSAFREYYSCAFPTLVRYVRNRTGWNVACAEDIAQEALLRFFWRMGRDRREALERLSDAAMQLRTVDVTALGATHPVGTVNALLEFADAVLACRQLPQEGLGPEQCKAVAADLWAEISALRSCGLRVLDALSRLQGEVPCDRDEDAAPAITIRPAGDGIDSEDAGERDIATSASRVPLQICAHLRAAAECEGGADIARLVNHVVTIIDLLPRLRLPTNGYLFDIANTTILDEIKKQRRKKRGGADARTSDGATGTGSLDRLIPHPLETLPDELQVVSEELDPDMAYDGLDHASGDPARSRSIASISLTSDPAVCYENEQFLQRFYDYLHAPVARALRAFQQAHGNGYARAERDRLECLARKFARTMTVLSLMGEGCTQEEAARRAGLTRNQVKYIVESVKQAYVQFVADAARASHARVGSGGESHAS